MAARATLRKIVKDDLQEGQPLALLGFTSVYASGSLDTPPDHQFIVIRWEDQGQVFGRFGPQRASVWFHTKDQDYGDIDKGIERLKDLLGAAVHVPGADGWTLTQADWRGDSGDLADDGYGTLTRSSSFDIVSRKTE